MVRTSEVNQGGHAMVPTDHLTAHHAILLKQLVVNDRQIRTMQKSTTEALSKQRLRFETDTEHLLFCIL